MNVSELVNQLYIDLHNQEFEVVFKDIDNGIIHQVFLETMNFIQLLNPDAIMVCLTTDVSIFIKLVFNEVHTYLELFFENEIGEIVEAVLNVYKNKESILAYGGTLEKSLELLKTNLK